MQKYSKYKDSGVKWLGEIPSHWEVKHLRNFLTLFSEKGFGDSQLLSVTREKGVILRDRDNKEKNHNFVPDDLSGYKHLNAGDFVINKMKSWQGSYGVSDYEGIVSPAYFTCKLHGINSKFFSRAIRSRAYIGFFMQFSKGIRVDQWDLDPNSMKEIPFVVPSNEEQIAIVNYLDSVTSKIDEAIAQQQKMIDLLNERKQIIINDAVTKGLDPKAKMKDSGIDWIGQIPEHWEIRRVASLGVFSKGAGISRDSLQDYGKPAILYGDIYTKYDIMASDIKHFVSASTAEKAVRIYDGDLLMTGSGETKEDIGKTIVYKGKEAYIGGDVILLRQSRNDSTFLSYCFNSLYAKTFRYKESKGEIIVHIYANAIKKMYIALPNIDEQKLIAKYLNEAILHINMQLHRISNLIFLLQERKQIIINDVVTGKVKVA